MFEDAELATIGALAETLVPADDSPGADAQWARAFVQRFVTAHPEERASFAALVAHVDALAHAAHDARFAALPIDAREALLVAHHPTLVDASDVSPEERALRRSMRDLITGFLTADDLDIRADPYALRRARRDRTLPSTIDYSAADRVPDVVHDRATAMWVGTGTYDRVWAAAGYTTPPGEPQKFPEDLARSPDELVALRRK